MFFLEKLFTIQPNIVFFSTFNENGLLWLFFYVNYLFSPSSPTDIVWYLKAFSFLPQRCGLWCLISFQECFHRVFWGYLLLYWRDCCCFGPVDYFLLIRWLLPVDYFLLIFCCWLFFVDLIFLAVQILILLNCPNEAQGQLNRWPRHSCTDKDNVNDKDKHILISSSKSDFRYL